MIALPVVAIPCKHWSPEPGSNSHGRCSIGERGGSPVYGYCIHVCGKFTGPDRWRQNRADEMMGGIRADAPERRGCCGQQTVPTMRWLGIRWYGLPWPKRLRMRSPFYVKPGHGCGCIVVLKDWWTRRRKV